jgi:hypothetical protein
MRILAEASEVPFALEETLTPTANVLEFTDVESQPGRDTVAQLDRGQHPAACDSLQLLIADGAPFLKPVVLESSDDGVAYRQIAKGSIFRTEGAQNLAIGFAPSDRRYLRLRLDDRFGPPIRPVSAKAHPVQDRVPLERYPIAAEQTTDTAVEFDTYTVALPAANLMVASLDVETDEKAFARNVRIQELVFFRGELSRRLVSDGQWTRSPSGDQVTGIKINATVGRRLEVDVEHLTNRLGIKQFAAWVRPRVMLFNAPANAHLRLAYGSSVAPAPHYDVGTALSTGMPEKTGTASLGATVNDASVPSVTAAPRRGQHIDVRDWQRRQPLLLPTQGTLAYLDLSGAVLRHLPSLRIVNAANAQVPYVVEADTRRTPVTLPYRVTEESGHTKLQITDLDPEARLSSLAITATEPAYFERPLKVTEANPNGRPNAERHYLGSAVWKRSPGDPATAFEFTIEAPYTKELEIDIDNGDDAPLTITGIAAQSPVRRLDFEFSPGEQLTAYWQNPGASSPRYDLSMIAGQILSSPAWPAQLGALEKTHEESAPTPKWFWWAVVTAGLIVAAALARVVMGPTSNTEH